MAFAVRLYSFSKKRNSTAIPGSGVSYSQVNCVNKGTLDILHPEIILKYTEGAEHNISTLVNTNYAYIPAFERWYYVRSWNNDGQQWTVSMDVDALASWRQTIGAQSIYIYRSAAAYNLRLTDNVYPQQTRPNRTIITLPQVWTEQNVHGTSIIGTIIAGIASGNGTKFYGFTMGSWYAFLNHLFSADYYNRVLGEFGATEYPEAKVAINPLQFITSCMFVPLQIGPNAGTYGIPYASTETHIKVGSVSVPAAAAISGYTAYEIMDSETWVYTISAPAGETGPIPDHPQISRGEYLNYSPYTSVDLFWPPCGTIPLDPTIIYHANNIKIVFRLDFRAGRGLLDVIAEFTSFPAEENHLYRGEFAIGAAIQLSNVMTPGAGPADAAWAGIMSNLFGGSEFAKNLYSTAANLPVIGGILSSGVSDAVHGNIPRLSTSGSFGTTATMAGTPAVIVRYWTIAAEDLTGKGRPLCEVRQISSIPGFMIADADELSLPCMDEEATAIRSAVSGGFYYE